MMARGRRDGLLIAGGGLSGCLAALAMAKARPEVPLLLVEESERFGGEQTWTFLDAEIAEEESWLVDPLVGHRWQGYYVAFPDHSRKLKAGSGAIRSADLDRLVRETLRPDQYRLGARIAAVREDELLLLGGERIRADGAIDARGAANLSMLDLGWRKYVGREYALAEPHRLDRPVMADATVEQLDGYRFIQCLPLSGSRMLVKDVRHANDPELDAEAIGAGLDAYVVRRGWKPEAVEREEQGALPLAIGGDFGGFWRVGGARVAKLGLRGGFFHPATGHSLADAVRAASLLTRQKSFEGAALHDLFEREAAALWKKRDFYRSFNAALFRAADPAERRALIERFYRLDPSLIARFQAGRSTMLDRMKVSALARRD